MSVILITGANQGLGFELTRRLAGHDATYKLILTSRNVERGKEAVAKLESQGFKNVVYQQLDVTDIDSVKNAVAFVKKTYAHLDTLVLNAALYSSLQAPTLYDNYLAVFDANVVGNVRMLVEFKELLYKAADAKVITISSGWGSMQEVAAKVYHQESFHVEESTQVYAGTKPALNSLILSYAFFYENHVRFLLVDPGYCATNMNEYQGADTIENGAKASFYGVTRNDWINKSFVRRNPDGEGVVPVPW